MRLLRLDEYVPALLAQGYAAVRDVTQLPWEDMEDIGIVKLGHQKKLLLAIKRVKDIVSGKWAGPPPPIGGPIVGSNLHAATYMVAPVLHTSWSQQQQQQQVVDLDEIEEFHQPLLFQSRPPSFPASYQPQQLQQQQSMSLGSWEQQQQQQLQAGFLDSTDDTTNDIVLIKVCVCVCVYWNIKGVAFDRFNSSMATSCANTTATRSSHWKSNQPTA